VDELARAALADLGGVDILVNTMRVLPAQTPRDRRPYLTTSGIRVSTVSPGTVTSAGVDLVREQLAAAAATQPKEMGTDVPLGRVGEPDDIANVVTFLVSDRAWGR
jgi:NAD(P)-dependent dehydrogenase (short-subunit alcohol dehydrogenase family)